MSGWRCFWSSEDILGQCHRHIVPLMFNCCSCGFEKKKIFEIFKFRNNCVRAWEMDQQFHTDVIAVFINQGRS